MQLYISFPTALECYTKTLAYGGPSTVYLYDLENHCSYWYCSSMGVLENITSEMMYPDIEDYRYHFAATFGPYNSINEAKEAYPELFI